MVKPTLSSIAEKTLAYWQMKHEQAIEEELKGWDKLSRLLTQDKYGSIRSNPAWGYMQRTTE